MRTQTEEGLIDISGLKKLFPSSYDGFSLAREIVASIHDKELSIIWRRAVCIRPFAKMLKFLIINLWELGYVTQQGYIQVVLDTFITTPQRLYAAQNQPNQRKRTK